METWRKYALIGLAAIVGILIIGGKIKGCISSDAPTLTTEKTDITVDQGSCLINCNSEILIVEGAEVEITEIDAEAFSEVKVVGDNGNLQEAAPLSGGNTAQLSGDGTSANYQEGSNLKNGQESSADESSSSKTPWGTILIIVLVLGAIAYFGWLRPQMMANRYLPPGNYM